MTGSRVKTVAEATPAWPAPPRPPRGAPNVALIVLDDVGFSQIGSYGASIRTPHMDGLADRGLRYTNFHVTALCSTTRASLLTGRNHHTTGMGFLADFDTGFDSYRGDIAPHAGTVAEMLSAAGYGTFASGKWHLTPPRELSASGPFNSWPTKRGFDRFYGFLGGEEDQWAPQLWQDQHYVDPPQRPGYHLSEDLVDRAIQYTADHVTATPDRPFFLYLAFGAGHAPHQAPRSFIDRYRNSFSHGWDVERKDILERQKHLGIVPGTANLPPRNPDVPSWDSLSTQERELCSRMHEVYAAFMEHTDLQLGRLLSFLDQHDLTDDTLILLLSDNGASGEGGRTGSANEYRYFLGLPDPFEDSYTQIDDLGGRWTHNHYPSGWAMAGNTPLKLYKRYTFGGGVRAPLIASWPAAIEAGSGIRTQFHHVIDLVPTILEAAGVTAPTHIGGVEQSTVHGTSMLYSFEPAEQPTRRIEQYFETAGHRGIYRNGLKAVTNHEPGVAYEQDTWELYDLTSDYSETANLADERPEVLASMVSRWWELAEDFDVLPLDDRLQERAEALDPHTEERREYRLLPGARLMNTIVGPNWSGRGFSVTASLERSENESEGTLLAYGRRAAGFALFLQNGRLVFDYNLAGQHTYLESSQEVPVGKQTLELRTGWRESEFMAQLLIGEQVVADGVLPRPFPSGFGTLATQCGFNSPSPVSPRYDSPFRLQGRLLNMVVVLEKERVSTADADWNAALAQE